MTVSRLARSRLRSTFYMNKVLRSASSPRRVTAFRRKVWGDIFGDLLREVRVRERCSIEQAAKAAGMTVAAWEAVEAGQVPQNWEEACRMADAISTDRSWMVTLVMFCQDAWN